MLTEHLLSRENDEPSLSEKRTWYIVSEAHSGTIPSNTAMGQCKWGVTESWVRCHDLTASFTLSSHQCFCWGEKTSRCSMGKSNRCQSQGSTWEWWIAKHRWMAFASSEFCFSRRSCSVFPNFGALVNFPRWEIMWDVHTERGSRFAWYQVHSYNAKASCHWLLSLHRKICAHLILVWYLKAWNVMVTISLEESGILSLLFARSPVVNHASCPDSSVRKTAGHILREMIAFFVSVHSCSVLLRASEHCIMCGTDSCARANLGQRGSSVVSITCWQAIVASRSNSILNKRSGCCHWHLVLPASEASQWTRSPLPILHSLWWMISSSPNI